jgi:extradiol dioxygenase family protein
VTAPANPFHLAFPVKDLASTRSFYGGLLGLREGRSAPLWIDYDFFGHQISAHVKSEACRAIEANDVDGDDVPVRHFGLVLEWSAWHALVARLTEEATPFLIAPHVRFQGQIGEQATFFVRDPSGNALEFKAFRDPARLFAGERKT